MQQLHRLVVEDRTWNGAGGTKETPSNPGVRLGGGGGGGSYEGYDDEKWSAIADELKVAADLEDRGSLISLLYSTHLGVFAAEEKERIEKERIEKEGIKKERIEKARTFIDDQKARAATRGLGPAISSETEGATWQQRQPRGAADPAPAPAAAAADPASSWCDFPVDSHSFFIDFQYFPLTFRLIFHHFTTAAPTSLLASMHFTTRALTPKTSQRHTSGSDLYRN